MLLPLDGLLVLDLAQYLAGPSAALRLSDLGARVVKVERPDGGEGGRRLGLAGNSPDGDSLLFHTINRGKESVTANLGDPDDRERVLSLVREADVLIHSFRPGALERFGLDFAALSAVNPRLVYAQVTGYGDSAWRDRPGQDLLVQARSGLVWLNGRADGPPEPFGLSVVDQTAGAYLVQGVLACLVRRGVTGRGGLVEVSLFEAAMDLQFEVFTAYLNGGGLPRRSAESAGHPYLGAPYGIYRTADGWIALAMGSLEQLGGLLGLPDLDGDWDRRDETKRRLASALVSRTTAEVLSVLEPAGYWCAEVRDWPALEASGVLDSLDLVVECGTDGSKRFRTLRCPVRIDGHALARTELGPPLGRSRT
ncbi:CaiB/BaiF CoA transferase family protein [Flindersiella endophytica]